MAHFKSYKTWSDPKKNTRKNNRWRIQMVQSFRYYHLFDKRYKQHRLPSERLVKGRIFKRWSGMLTGALQMTFKSGTQPTALRRRYETTNAFVRTSRVESAFIGESRRTLDETIISTFSCPEVRYKTVLTLRAKERFPEKLRQNSR